MLIVRKVSLRMEIVHGYKSLALLLLGKNHALLLLSNVVFRSFVGSEMCFISHHIKMLMNGIAFFIADAH